MTKVIVGLSGGVDSSVTALLLKNQGFEVTGITMKTWDGSSYVSEGPKHGCYGPGEEEDIENAKKVADILKIPFYTFDLSQEYNNEILDYVRKEYLTGRTPNPCVKCNFKIKFNALLKKVKELGIDFDYFATGHYATIEYDSNLKRFLLKRGKDRKKDQSYFLSYLSQEQLKNTFFPLGDYLKKDVKKIARDFNLGFENIPESQNFFSGDYSLLLNTHNQKEGLILDTSGKILGKHKGIAYYTVGQRRGLGLSAERPLYVIKIDKCTNSIVVGYEEELYKDTLIASGLNWIGIEKLLEPIEAEVKIRYMHKEAEAIIYPINEEKVLVKFKEPQRAITPGQVAVFYKGDIVIGGGFIE